jgi:hypothetical protein
LIIVVLIDIQVVRPRERAPSAPIHEQLIAFCEEVVKQLRVMRI